MSEYKSRRISFFKNKKLLEMGEYVTPAIVKLFSKVFKNEKIVGRGVEYIVVIFLFLSVYLFIK